VKTYTNEPAELDDPVNAEGVSAVLAWLLDEPVAPVGHMTAPALARARGLGMTNGEAAVAYVMTPTLGDDPEDDLLVGSIARYLTTPTVPTSAEVARGRALLEAWRARSAAAALKNM